eukprot:GEMP01073252.1.p1 GENE.GEMP01073252.1~~GEMP01073252.1.p1  ORF type:complete len:305 (+),score=57.90 GEMP01073252.1:224-1138(+)
MKRLTCWRSYTTQKRCPEWWKCGTLQDSSEAPQKVVRCFAAKEISTVEGSPTALDPVREFNAVQDELMLSDLEFATRRLPALEKKSTNCTETEKALPVARDILAALEASKPARTVVALSEAPPILKDFTNQLLTMKPIVCIANVNPEATVSGNEFSDQLQAYLASRGVHTLVLSANLESEAVLCEDVEFRKEYLESYGLEKTKVGSVLRTAQKMLNLDTYYTAGDIEARAWFVTKNSKAPDAAAVIHSDFKKAFQGADVWNWRDIAKHGSKAAVKAAGLVKQRGKDYVVQDGDVIEFRIRNAKS